MGINNSTHKSVTFFLDVQRALSKAQGVPIFGLIPSVFKFAFSILQLAGSIAIGAPTFMIALVTDSNAAGNVMEQCLEIGLIAGVSMGYSLLNIFSLTTVGFVFEYGLDRL
jgi:hypothetical protein